MEKLINTPTVQDTKPAIVVNQLCKSFDGRTILDSFNLTVNKNENVVVLGKSGSGKSVLIKCIIGLLKPEKGRIEVFGQDVVPLQEMDLDKIRSKIGFLFQGNAIYDSMTVRENLEFPLRRRWIKLSQQEINQRVEQALDDVNLRYTIDMMPSELSGGMVKRVALARTIILKPDIILYDEPTTGLDPITAKEIDELIINIKQRYHTASITISHDMKCVEHTADRVVLLLDGKCYAEGSYQDFERSEDKNIKQFFE